MWHASSGGQTFSGSYGLMLPEGIHRMIDEMNQLHGIDEEFEIGLRAFDLQTREQKSWSLHQVAFGLLDEATAIVELNAYLEATIVAIFYQLDGCIQIPHRNVGWIQARNVKTTFMKKNFTVRRTMKMIQADRDLTTDKT